MTMDTNMAPETREVLPSLLELTAGEIEALIHVHKTMRDRLAGKEGHVAEFHNDVLIALADERERRAAALAAMSDQLADENR